MSTHITEAECLQELTKQCRKRKSCYITVVDGRRAFEERFPELAYQQMMAQAQQILQELAESGRLTTPPSLMMCAEVNEIAEWCGDIIAQPYHGPLYSHPMIIKMVSEEILLPELEEIGELYGVRKYLAFSRDSINDMARELDCKMSVFTCLNYLLSNCIIHWVTRSHGVVSDPDVKHLILSSNPDEVADLTDEESIKLNRKAKQHGAGHIWGKIRRAHESAQYGLLSPNDPYAGCTVEELAELSEQAGDNYCLYHPL